MVLILLCWFHSTQDLFSKPRILVHAERWCLPALSIVCGSARTWEGNIETKPIQDWHWSCVHSQGSLLTSHMSLLFIARLKAGSKPQQERRKLILLYSCGLLAMFYASASPRRGHKICQILLLKSDTCQKKVMSYLIVQLIHHEIAIKLTLK